MLPALEGSEKQIAWGERIRLDRLNRWKKADPLRFNEIKTDLFNLIAASHWIANKDKELEQVLPFIAGEKWRDKCSKPEGSMPNGSSHVDSTSGNIKTFEACTDGLHRHIGELRDIRTGEPVVCSECPF